MQNRRTVRRFSVALLLTVSLLIQGTWALAGTTGLVSGAVIDDSGAPISAATVTLTSPSQHATTRTDASGHFIILNLQPDTYTVAAAKEGYAPVSNAGVTVFADQTSVANLRTSKTLKTIATATSKSAGSLVKSGVGGDLYNVDAAAIGKSAALGGGGNLDNAYSAVAGVPGVAVPIATVGWNQAVYVRGAQAFFTGFEYDGVPVNRSFDNYNASTFSNLGLQELQVYTGGGPGSTSSAGTSGFINQVIKTGTYPGSGTLNGTIAGPSFYHAARVEAGGSNPSRSFSYYAGFSGYTQNQNLIDQQNGAGTFGLDGVYAPFGVFTANNGAFANSGFKGVFPICNAATGLSPIPLVTSACLYPNSAASLFNQTAQITNRENVINFHFAIPRKNSSLRDDLQLMWSGSALFSTAVSSTNDGGGLNPFTLAVTGLPYCAPNGVGPGCAAAGGPNFPHYVDAVNYNLQFGQAIAGHAAEPYFQPASPLNRALGAALPNNLRDTISNTTGVVKLQYTHELSANAYIRAFGYTYYSDWLQSSPQSAYNNYFYGIGGPTDGAFAANYELPTHTTGGELQFVDQLNAQNLLQVTANYTRANVVRWNNTGYIGGASPIGYVSQNGGGFQCWDPTAGTQDVGCIPGSGYASNSVAHPNGVAPTAPAGSPAALAGARWVSLWNGNTNGSFNTVQPQFSFLSLNDQWRPNDKLMLDVALRGEIYYYGLANSNTPGNNFYSAIVKSSVCQNASGQVLTTQLAPGAPPPAPTLYEAVCPAGFAHPNFTATSPSSYILRNISPRASLTYTQSPDTVWRASGGRYTEPPISASVQYLARSGNNLSVWGATLPLGFNSPFHPIPEMSATNFDLSLERHIGGTDMSFKISPFYNTTRNYQEQSFIGPNFVTQAPVGLFKSTGVEASLQKGDFSRNGFAGSLSATYTHARVQYQTILGPNQLDGVNSAIKVYNQLTKNGGGAPCYAPVTSATIVGGGTPMACSNPTAIANPYYNLPTQGAIDPSGWFPAGNAGLSAASNPSTTYFDLPWVVSLVANYRHDRWALTPTIQYLAGNGYGGPLDVSGIDPRACGKNSAASGITAVSPHTNPLQCNYLTSAASQNAAIAAAPILYIPNPQTGSFATPGAYSNPGVLLGNLALSYDVSAKISAQVSLTSLFHACFGGSSEAWTSAYPPGSNTCGYTNSPGTYISNAYNGTGQNDVAANGVKARRFQTQSYSPTFAAGTGGQPFPFNAYFSVNVKI